MPLALLKYIMTKFPIGVPVLPRAIERITSNRKLKIFYNPYTII